MSRALSVAVVQGGASTEAEVSRASAKGVAAALEEAGHRVVRLELDAFLSESLRTGGYDVVFPVAHGALGEDGSLQGLLEVLGMPYVGSGVLGSALAMHKRIARVLFERAGLPVAKGIAVTRAEGDARAAAARARREVGARLVVKPSSHGSAIGVTRLEAAAPLDDVARAVDAVWAIDDVAVIEHFARGREMTCGVLEMGAHGAHDAHEAHEAHETDAPLALPPTEILSPKDPFYTYEARYAPGRSVHVCPAQLPPAVFARVQDVALGAFRAVGARDLARVDLIVGDEADENPEATGRSQPGPDAVTLLEVNTLPGMTATSLFPEAAAVHGLPMPRWCDALVVRAHARGPTKRLPPLPLPL